MLDAWFHEDLRDNPTFATNLGLDTGELAHLRGELGDAVARRGAGRPRQGGRARTAQLQAFGRDGLSAAGAAQLRHRRVPRRASDADGARFPYGSAGGRPGALCASASSAAPITACPTSSTPSIRSATRQDADYYLARLEQFARNLDQETERVRHDASLGVVPPDFILDKAIPNLERLRATPAAETTLVRSLVRRTRAPNIAGDWEARAAASVSGPIAAGARPADRGAARDPADAPSTMPASGGCPRARPITLGHPLQHHDRDDRRGDPPHRASSRSRELQAELDRLLRAAGLHARASVGERINALNDEERFLYPEHRRRPRRPARRAQPAGRGDHAAAAAGVQHHPARRGSRSAGCRSTIEAGAPGGYYQGAPLDGSRPGHLLYQPQRHRTSGRRLGLPTLT